MNRIHSNGFRWMLLVLSAGWSCELLAAPLSDGNLLVYRVDGSGAALSSSAAKIFVDEYQLNGVWVQSFEMPSGPTGIRLTGSGTATSEGKLSVSPSGNWVALLGYDAEFSTPSVKSTLNRTIARISASNGAVDLSTSGPLGGNDNARGVTVDDTGTNFWAAMNGTTGTDSPGRGLRYLSLGQTTTGPLLAGVNARGASVQGGQLYEWGDASGNYGISAVGAGLPTAAGQTLTGLPGLSGDIDLDCYGFFLADLSLQVDGFDTIWVARDATGVSKYSLIAGTWTLNNTLDPGAVYHLAGRPAEGGALLAIIEGGRLMTLSDTTGYNADMTGTFTELAAPGANQAFRGVAFTAIPEPGTFTLLSLAALAVARRIRKPG